MRGVADGWRDVYHRRLVCKASGRASQASAKDAHDDIRACAMVRHLPRAKPGIKRFGRGGDIETDAGPAGRHRVSAAEITSPSGRLESIRDRFWNGLVRREIDPVKGPVANLTMAGFEIANEGEGDAPPLARPGFGSRFRKSVTRSETTSRRLTCDALRTFKLTTLSGGSMALPVLSLASSAAVLANDQRYSKGKAALTVSSRIRATSHTRPRPWIHRQTLVPR
mmetsp:Transcript_56862/g.157354  ORF Transcript_56862/g.157354 Transcript_56862/m.157354 type:complete len:224 (-) Transcript_56862:1224-1895(-)